MPANNNTNWGTTMVGLKSAPGEKVVVPASAYKMDTAGKYQAVILYADPNRVTLKYTNTDTLAGNAYAIHLEGITVDPTLVALYNDADKKGRLSLPGLQAGQLVGMANSNEVKVAIRDTGAFMDPRSRKDWWQSPDKIAKIIPK